MLQCHGDELPPQKNTHNAGRGVGGSIPNGSNSPCEGRNFVVHNGFITTNLSHQNAKPMDFTAAMVGHKSIPNDYPFLKITTSLPLKIVPILSQKEKIVSKPSISRSENVTNTQITQWTSLRKTCLGTVKKKQAVL